MKIAFITAGAAGMFCGSCLRDNALVKALRGLGHDAMLIPTYTPITTDDENVSDSHLFYGGINVFLQEKSRLFRHTPRFIDKLFDFRWLLRWASRHAHRTQYDKLGGMTVSLLQGEHGHQRKELDRLVNWLKEEVKPEALLLTNVLLSGMIPELKRALGIPIFATLQGDDIFLEALTPPDRERCKELIRENCSTLDGLIATSAYYADHMSGYLGLDRSRIRVVLPGIDLAGHGGERIGRSDRRPVIGFFARIAPEKGLHHLVDAFIELRKTTDAPRFKVSGWFGEQHKAYFEEQKKKLDAAGLLVDFEHVESPDHASKSHFLRSVDLLCVPTVYREPKGLYVLEAWANGTPLVLPSHGCFTELINDSGGGVLVPPNDTKALAAALGELIAKPDLAKQYGAAGQAAVRDRYSSQAMAANTIALLERFAGARS